MILSDALQRRVKPQKENDQGLESYDNGSDSSNAGSEGLNDSAEDEISQSVEDQDESTVCDMFQTSFPTLTTRSQTSLITPTETSATSPSVLSPRRRKPSGSESAVLRPTQRHYKSSERSSKARSMTFTVRATKPPSARPGRKTVATLPGRASTRRPSYRAKKPSPESAKQSPSRSGSTGTRASRR